MEILNLANKKLSTQTTESYQSNNKNMRDSIQTKSKK